MVDTRVGKDRTVLTTDQNFNFLELISGNKSKYVSINTWLQGTDPTVIGSHYQFPPKGIGVTIKDEDIPDVIDFLQKHLDSRPKLTPPAHPGSVVKADYNGNRGLVLVKNGAEEWDDITGWFDGLYDDQITVREIVFEAPEGLIKE